MEMPWAARLWIRVSSLLLHAVLSQGAVTCATIGETAELSCNVILTGGLHLRAVTWTKLGSPDVVVARLSGGESAYAGRATVNSTGFLLLNNTREPDLATYRCVASLSNFASLPVVETPLQTASPSENVTCTSNVTADEFQNTTIVCNTTSCPASTIQWEDLPSGITPTVGDNAVTVTFDVRKAHEGIFMCKAVNSLGEGTCQTTLTVPNYQPIIRVGVHLDVYTVDKLEGWINVTVHVEGTPEPVITWVREGYPNETGNSLIITSDMAGNYDGNYSCWASNYIGEVSCGTFTVKGTVWKFALVITIPAGAVVSLSVVAGYYACRRKKKCAIRGRAEDGNGSNSPGEADTSGSVGMKSMHLKRTGNPMAGAPS